MLLARVLRLLPLRFKLLTSLERTLLLESAAAGRCGALIEV